MFCSHCASPIEADATFCTSCGASVSTQLSPADRAIARARTTTEDAQLAARFLLKDPFGSLGENYTSLGELKARSAALGFFALFTAITAFAMYRNIPRGLFGFGGQNDFRILIASMVFGALIPTVMAPARMLARMTFRAKGDLTADLFVTSVCLLAYAPSFLLFGLFRLDSDISGILIWGSFLIASPFSLLIQYESNIQLSNLAKNKAAWMISLTLVYATILFAIAGALIRQIFA